ncbi:phoenix isoform X2 [Leuresthes tenuis]
MLASLPTVDMDGDHISPISEEEEDPPKDEEFKVVERKRFVVPSKAKSSQSWYITKKTNNKIKKQKGRPSNARTDSQGRQWKAIYKAPTSAPSIRVTLSPDTDCSDHEDSSCSLLQDKEKSDKDVTSSGNIVAQSETSKAERTPKQGKEKTVFNRTENENKLVNDSDAIVCESRREKCKQKSREASTAVTALQTNDFQRECEPESHHLLQNDYNNDIQCSETGVKKKKKKKKKKGQELETVEEKNDQSREELEGESLGVATTEVGKAQSMSQVVDEPDATDSKKKKKKKKSAAKDVRQDADEQSVGRGVEDSAVSCSTENGHKKKKKKRKTNVDDHSEVECFQTNAAAEHLADDGEIPKKKKKRIKELKKTSDLLQIPTEHLEETGDCFENAEAYDKTLESSPVKRKKKKKKKQSNYDTQVGEDARKDVDFSNDSVTLVRSTDLLVKKKMRKNVHISFTPEEDENFDNPQTTEALEEQDAEITIKKKKKKKKSAKTSTDVSEDTMAPSEYSASAWKKETKRTSSFLAADEEENAEQMHRKTCTPSQSTAAHGWCAEKSSVSDFATEPAEITGNLEDPKDGVKKKKRSAAQETLEGESECEEPEEASEAVIKKKKKRKRDGRESVSHTERLESAADEIVVLTKGKKKKKDAQGTPPAVTEDAEPEESTLNTCVSFWTQRKGKHGRSAEIPHDSNLSNDQTSRETPVGYVRDNKKKMAEMEALKTKKKERKKQTADWSFKSAPSKTSDSQLKTSSSNSIRKNSKAKRKLYSPSDDFLADC